MSTSAGPYKSPGTEITIELDPQHDGNIIRKAFLAESVLNLFTIPLITNTRTILSYLLANPSQINSTSIFFARLFGGLIVGGLTSALWAGLPNTKTGIESRKVVYITLGMGEVFLLPILALEAAKAASGEEAALSVLGCGATIACLLPPLLWRAYVLFVKPELMGRYREVKRD
ncbi:hypothetical protein H2200_005341 [Cladophialophora chaetospira]|uniref:Uncharacterized protein n=1 Tax=Cladophialophora chaetospira TaxID=386627 RepID=A0AA38XCG8_9EURO|nr:hypothetical protein H2200_005341 [Cladophialophora chaetospira]